MSILISQGGGNAQRLDSSSFDSEDYLQKYISENPSAIPLYEISEDTHLLILAREFRAGSGRIDAIGVDKNGGIYIVETKLYGNPDKRLVVAQVLDYGAALWAAGSDYNQFTADLNAGTQKQFKQGLDDKLSTHFDLDEEGLETLLSNLQDNLNKGNFQFVVLMDKLDSQLKDLIIFLNENCRFSVFAVELEYYKHAESGSEIMIPKLFGAEVRKEVSTNGSGSRRKRWNEQDFFREVNQLLPTRQADAVRRLYDFSVSHAPNAIVWGTGMNEATFSAKFFPLSTKPLFVIHSDGTMKIGIEYPRRVADAEQSKRLDDLNRGLDAVGLHVKPDIERTSIALVEWLPKLDVFIDEINKVLSLKS